MRIAVVGAGALGLYYGALLQKGGNEVVFLLRRDYDAITASGLTVRSINGDFHLDRVDGARTSSEIGVVDLVLVGLKTIANDHYQELIAPLVGEGTFILTLQNGLGNEEKLAELFGAERIIGGVAFLCSNRREPGVVEHLGAGRIEIGAFSGASERFIALLAETFTTAGVECRQVSDLKSARWQKLVWNIPFNTLSALMDVPVDRLLANGQTRKLLREIMIEVIDAANAQGLSKDIDHGYADTMIAFTEGMGPYLPSMLIDRREGRQLELEAIMGRPIAMGEAKGISLTRTSTVHALLSLVCDTLS